MACREHSRERQECRPDLYPASRSREATGGSDPDRLAPVQIRSHPLSGSRRTERVGWSEGVGPDWFFWTGRRVVVEHVLDRPGLAVDDPHVDHEPGFGDRLVIGEPPQAASSPADSGRLMPSSESSAAALFDRTRSASPQRAVRRHRQRLAALANGGRYPPQSSVNVRVALRHLVENRLVHPGARLSQVGGMAVLPGSGRRCVRESARAL